MFSGGRGGDVEISSRAFEMGSCLYVGIWIWILAPFLSRLHDASLSDVCILEVHEMFKVGFTVHQSPLVNQNPVSCVFTNILLFCRCFQVDA